MIPRGMLRKPDPDSSSKTATNGPFFTVMVPTMNRPRLLKAAIHTVMWQTFTDFELIVSDNSNDEESRTKNRAALEEYAEDPRVHYIHPDRWMNMPDHWEFATRHASGRYVVILTDRHVMRPSALEYLHSQINELPKESGVISWHDCSAFLDASGILVAKRFTGKTEVLDSKKMAREYARFADWGGSRLFSNRLPRMLNSCYRFDVAQAIRKEHDRLFIPVSPDYTAAFLFLAYTDNMVYLDRPLFMSHGLESNGKKSVMYGVEGYRSTLGDVDIFAGTPVRLNTTFNTIVRDLLAAKDLVGTRFSDVHVDWVGYYLFNYSEILWKERLGSPMNIGALREQWWDGVGKLTPEQQTEIKEHVKELDQQRVAFIGLRRLVVRMGLDPCYHSVMGKLKHVRQKLAGQPVFANVFEAAMRTDHILY